MKLPIAQAGLSNLEWSDSGLPLGDSSLSSPGPADGGVARPFPLSCLHTIGMALCCAFLATGCGLFGSDDDPLEAELATVRDGGRTVPLHDLTDFAWDEVHVFNEYTRSEVIEEVVGSPVIGSDRHMSGSLLVFENDGSVVKKIEVSGDYIRATGSTFGADVLAVPMGENGLRLEGPA